MKTFFISLLLLLIHYVAAAQQVNIEEIKSSKFKGVKAIEGKGYYLIYQTEDAEGKNKKFEVQTFDHDLKLIKKFELILPKGSEASGGEFNGVNFVLTFTNDKENQIDLMSYTPDGVLAGKKNT
ncbi:MAG TPA: hypothetical protein PLD84_09190 [Chitinophagales bacterium]|nr:hypothetical protein [Chitinophagales bacterium]